MWVRLAEPARYFGALLAAAALGSLIGWLQNGA